MAEQPGETFTELGSDNGRGNLLGIQAALRSSDYRSRGSFRRALEQPLRTAREKGWLNSRSVAVYPEYCATWLVAAGEPGPVTTALSLKQAMSALIRAHLFSFARRWLAASEAARAEAALFRIKAPAMAADYTAVFSALAKEYAITIVAGSILLPGARVAAGRVVAGSKDSPLQNISALFQPDGSAHPALTRKCFPTQEELRFTAPARLNELPVYETPAGRLGVLICADSWFPQAYAHLAQRGIDLLAVPSCINQAAAWAVPWGGYSGWPNPPDIDPADIGSLSEGQAWQKYALAGRLASSGAAAGVNVFLQGPLWDLGTDGCSLIVNENGSRQTSPNRAALLNLWV